MANEKGEQEAALPNPMTINDEYQKLILLELRKLNANLAQLTPKPPDPAHVKEVPGKKVR